MPWRCNRGGAGGARSGRWIVFLIAFFGLVLVDNWRLRCRRFGIDDDSSERHRNVRSGEAVRTPVSRAKSVKQVKQSGEEVRSTKEVAQEGNPFEQHNNKTDILAPLPVSSPPSRYAGPTFVFFMGIEGSGHHLVRCKPLYAAQQKRRLLPLTRIVILDLFIDDQIPEPEVARTTELHDFQETP